MNPNIGCDSDDSLLRRGKVKVILIMKLVYLRNCSVQIYIQMRVKHFPAELASL